MAKICIDPGHYGKYNRCPAIPEYYESEMVWKLSQYQKKFLEEMGHTVILTREDPNKDLELTARGRKSQGCDLFISNHSNAVGNGMNESIRYAAIYHLVEDHTTTCDDKSAEFAQKIAPVIGKVMGVAYRILTRKAESDRNKDGFKNDNYYGVLHGARMVNTPGLILEHSFHTNSESVRWLLNDENLQKLAKEEALCIAGYFSEKGPVMPIDPEIPPYVPDIVIPTSNFKVRVSIDTLNIRKGPGIDYETAGYFIPKGVYTITEVKNGKGSKTGWGRLKSGAGWISLDYAPRM